MRKVLTLLTIIILLFFFMNIQVNSLTANNITMMLKPNQIGVTFINNEKLLVHLEKKEFIVKINNDRFIIEDNKNNNISNNQDINFNIYNDYKRIIINYQNNNLCIVKDNSFNDCQYVYMVNDKNVTEIPENINLVIYDTNIKEETILRNYNNWIDTHELNNDYYTTLIWDEKEYQIMRMPKKEYQILN